MATPTPYRDLLSPDSSVGVTTLSLQHEYTCSHTLRGWSPQTVALEPLLTQLHSQRGVDLLVVSS